MRVTDLLDNIAKQALDPSHSHLHRNDKIANLNRRKQKHRLFPDKANNSSS